MPDAITNTSPLLYLHRIHSVDWLPLLFSDIWVPNAVVSELNEGRRRGYDVLDVADYSWLQIASPRQTPSEWLALDLGAGELSVLSLALENPERVVLLDDKLARRVATAAHLEVWGTLRIILEAKSRRLTASVKPILLQLHDAGMWMSNDIQQRILALAGEAEL